MSKAFTYSVDSEGIAWVIFDLPGSKVNTIDVDVLNEFESILDTASNDKSVKILVIKSGKEDCFIAGADLHSFEPIFKDPSKAEGVIRAGHNAFSRLANLPFPTVALIDGVCFGGGTELSLACTYRIASDHPKTSIALPEVTLGIYPGWGGSQRLPRLIGLLQGLPFILGGKGVNGTKAYKMKLVDGVVAHEFIDSQARVIIRRLLTPEGKKQVLARRKPKGLTHYLLEGNPLGRHFIFQRAEKDVLKKTKGHYPAPLILLDLIKETCTLPLKQGLEKEITTFVQNLTTGFGASRHLIRLFFTSEALKKDNGVSGDVKGRAVKAAGVLGAGTMGSLIAWLFSYRDIPVRMKDIDWTCLGRGFAAAFGVYKSFLKKKKLTANEVSLKFYHISGTTDYTGFKDLDLVVEAAIENLELKQKILKEMEEYLSDDAIIGTNTSSLPVSELGKVLKHPERFVGMHFFNPPDKMPLVEVVATDKSSPEAIVTAVETCRKLGKTPIVVKECPGLLVNRIFLPGANEVMRMYEEGASFEKLEKVMLDFGMPMSPFILADEVGNDVAYHVSKIFENAYGKRMEMPKLVALMYDNKLFGKKSGAGFYTYQGRSHKVNPKAVELRNQLLTSGETQFANEDIRDRVILIMVNEAARCLDEGIVANSAYLDMALIMGIGFPPFRGGLLAYADDLGIDYVVKTLKRFQEAYGDRFAPCKKLLEMQKNGATFYN